MIKKANAISGLLILQNKKQIRECKRHESELIDDEKYMYTHEDIRMSIIMSFRVSAPETAEFRSRIGFKQHDKILTKKQWVKRYLQNEKLMLQHSVLGNRTDVYFPKHKLALELMKKAHWQRLKKEKEREKRIK